ncbi:MAG TPA: hypothetical protein VKY26_04260 [Actinomycetota bacterium]|nr:hypothetical protein [Actinomycetota bacterium]
MFVGQAYGRCGLAAQNILTVMVFVVAIGFGIFGYAQFRRH